MDYIMEHLMVGIAVMFVIIACRVFQANVALALGDDRLVDRKSVV